MKISLVIPVRDEEHSLDRLIGSILVQERPPEEVVFVDAGSVDRTADMLEKRRDLGEKFTILSIGAAYPGAARNAGVKAAAHDTIVFTDGGIELDKAWLKELCAAMEDDPEAGIIYGSYVPRTDTLFKECLAIATVPPGKYAAGAKMRSHFIASSIIRKSVWAAAGGFPDLRAAEDRIFMGTVEKMGFRAGYCPKAVVTWDIPEDVASVFRRFNSYSYHDLKAGRANDWHVPVLKMYSAASLFVIMGALISPFFFIVPAAGLGARVARKIYINREEPYFKPAHLAAYAVFSGILILIIDFAMFMGWARYMAEAISGKLRNRR